MKASIITIGDELLIGQVIDTNKAWMGKELSNLGIEIIQVLTIRDDEKSIFDALNYVIPQSDLVLMSGGLGPTNDDRTKYVLAKYYNSELEFHQPAYDNLEQILMRRVGSINKLNNSQAILPTKCKPLINPYGTASAMWFEENNTILVAMAGVPYEMKYSVSEQIIPLLKERFSFPATTRKSILIMGYTEAGLAEFIEGWENQLPAGLALAYLPSLSGIRLRFTYTGKNIEESNRIIFEELQKLKSILGNSIVSESDKTAAELLGDLLKKERVRIATAESCTGGLIAHKITEVAGASEYFKGSIVAYSNEVKENFLGVNHSTLVDYGAVSQETVEEMVVNLCARMEVQTGIAVSGIAGPGGGTEDKPVGTIWIAWHFKGKTWSKLYAYNKSRSINIDYASNKALMGLIMEILGCVEVKK